MDISRHILPNGLRLVHVYDPSTAMVAVNTLYNVGARDERPEMTGIAHLFEHLMFGGSANIADFDGQLSAAGGNSNAWTSSDFTNFYCLLPAENLATALWLESDRMLQLAFSEKSLEVQRSVVIEEFKQVCLNRPYGDMDHQFRDLCYTVHPYRIPVIGKDFTHIEKVMMNDVRDWFYRHYAPNNAVLAICGNVPFREAVELVEHYYSDIPRRDIAPRSHQHEPDQTAPKSRIITRDVPQTALRIGYPMSPYGSQAYFEADTISDILSNGRSSRFYRRLLLGSDMFTELDASISGSEEEGLFIISAKLTGNGEEAERQATDAINRELRILAAEPPSERELRRCINLLESNRTFSNLNCLAVAQTIATAELHGENPDDFMRPYRAHTPAAITRAASALFSPDRSNTLIVRPSGN